VLQLEVHSDHEAVSGRLAALLRAAFAAASAPVVLAATGATPIRGYELAAAAGPAPPGARFVQLDEYAGIPHDDRRSLYGWMRGALLDPLAVGPDRVAALDGTAADLDAVCRDHDAAIAGLGGIDLAILGLGPNGHLGFNEPPSAADAPSRVVDLAPASVASNATYWGSEADVPRRALTTGMRAILATRTIVLVVSGARKRDILARTLRGEVTPDVPASLLRTCPGSVVVLADAAAAHG
jgi:glucosamine-6-phosphate deaminase